MSNWVYNKITGPGLDQIKALILDDEGNVEFNRLIQKPAHEPSSFFAEGNLGEENRAAHPDGNWYDWGCEFWGTKWGACETWICADALSFQTAWAMPQPIVFAVAAHVKTDWTWVAVDQLQNFADGFKMEGQRLLFAYKDVDATAIMAEADELEKLHRQARGNKA